MNRYRPTGVSLIAVLYFIGGIASIIICIALLAFSGSVRSAFYAFADAAALIDAWVIPIALGMLAGGALSFAIGWGLWELRDWARITAIVFGCIGILSGLGSLAVVYQITSLLISALVEILVYGAIVFYLCQPAVVQSFRPVRVDDYDDKEGKGAIKDTQGQQPYQVIDKTKQIPEPVDAAAWLVPTRGVRKLKHLPLRKGRNTVGRDPSRCDVVLDDPTVGRSMSVCSLSRASSLPMTSVAPMARS